MSSVSVSSDEVNGAAAHSAPATASAPSIPQSTATTSGNQSAAPGHNGNKDASSLPPPPFFKRFLGIAKADQDQSTPLQRLAYPELFGPRFLFVLAFIIVALIANPTNLWGVMPFCSYTAYSPLQYSTNPSLMSTTCYKIEPKSKCMQTYLAKIGGFQIFGYIAVVLTVISAGIWVWIAKRKAGPDMTTVYVSLVIGLLFLVAAVLAQLVNGGFTTELITEWVVADCPNMLTVTVKNLEKPVSLVGSIFSALLGLSLNRFMLAGLAIVDLRKLAKARAEVDAAASTNPAGMKTIVVENAAAGHNPQPPSSAPQPSSPSTMHPNPGVQPASPVAAAYMLASPGGMHNVQTAAGGHVIVIRT